MEKDTKVKVVAEVTELAEQAKAVVLAGFTGLSVEDETKLRREVREVNGAYRVVRNTLARRALADEQWEGVRAELKGNTALAFTNEDVVGLMKTLVDFSKDNKALSIKCGLLDGKPLSAEDVKSLASMPPREVLLSRLANVLQSPIVGLVNVLSGNIRNLAQVVKALADKKSEGGEA